MRKTVTIILGILMLSICYSAAAKLSLKNNFVGIGGEMLVNVRTRLKLEQDAITQARTLTTNDVQQLNKKAPKEISKALQPYGYFKPQITSKLNYINYAWHATYYINLGSPLKITKLNVKITGAAALDPKFIKLLQQFPLRQGDIFIAQNYKYTKQKLFELTNNRGYLAAKMEQSVVQINLENYTATIIMRFNSGPRYTFGPAIIPKSKFSQEFIERFLAFQHGEFYSSAKIQKTQQNFHDSNLFQSVIIEPELKQAKNLQVPILIHIIPHKTLQFSVGAGYGTDTGIRGSLGLNINNIGSTGQHLNGVVRASQKTASFEASYIVPGKNPVTSQYDISAGSKIEDYDYGFGHLNKIGPGYTTIIHNWHQTIRADIVAERWHFDGENNKFATLIAPSIMWLRTKANDPIRPTRGYRVSLMLQGAPFIDLQESSTSLGFIQAQASFKFLYPIPKGPILVVRGNLGYTAIRDRDLDKMPISFWFSAGGAQSIRGFRYQKVGYGTELSTFSVELRQRVYGNWYLAAFLDMGNSGNDIFSADKNLLHNMFFYKGAGIGVVWLSPIGSVQLSFAKPLTGSDRDGVIQFSMGPEL